MKNGSQTNKSILWQCFGASQVLSNPSITALINNTSTKKTDLVLNNIELLFKSAHLTLFKKGINPLKMA
eukprot:UN03513